MQSKKTILFDLDGVLTVPEEVFSVVYSRSRGLDTEPFTRFFQTEWADFVTGKRDLKEYISQNPELWHWGGTADELLELWFRTEDVRNDALLETIRQLRSRGVRCYVATEQEKYRTQYVREVMFPDEFDGVFSTAEIGYRKTDEKFFLEVLNTLVLDAEDVIFFDDSMSKVAAADKVGLDARLFTSEDQVRQLLDL